MNDVFQRFRESVQGKLVEKTTEIERVECEICGVWITPGPCPNCGHIEGNEEKPIESFVKSIGGRKV